MSPFPASSYDKFPTVTVPGHHQAWTGHAAWQEAARADKPVVVDTYPGVRLDELKASIAEALPGHRILDVEDLAALPIADIDALIAANLTDDRVFGVLSHHTLADFYDAGRLAGLATRVSASDVPVVLVGWEPPWCRCPSARWSSRTWRAGNFSSASEPGPRTGAATTPTRTTCASTSAAFSWNGGWRTGTSGRCSPPSTTSWTPTAASPGPR
ncbi:hypothetical protein [Arthrobacter sp. SD76]|uniref:hypothetical protein n=1 Tax=Arthrobacter sp. SD76 TaxID=3415007 RepID=UPI003C794785